MPSVVMELGKKHAISRSRRRLSFSQFVSHGTFWQALAATANRPTFYYVTYGRPLFLQISRHLNAAVPFVQVQVMTFVDVWLRKLGHSSWFPKPLHDIVANIQLAILANIHN